MSESLLPRPSRRRFLSAAGAAVASAALVACTTARPPRREPLPVRPAEPPAGSYAAMYGPMVDDGHAIPGIPLNQIEERYLRQMVPDPTGEQPGTIVVDTGNHYLYLVREGGMAMRYGVGLGREGFEWAGRGEIQWKQPWPRWFPPDEMIDRQPELEKYRARQIPGTNDWEGGMEAGITNPLGARALYIFQDGKDTLYRIHGSPEWWSIGKSVSSGCVRLMNQDIIDLYDRVPEGSPVLVRSAGSPLA
ncbi:MAG: L,D-transpeptidase [Rhizobiaceae bacterium]|nr:L,D-transpeptidase [Rhizobiaceae bacterium]MCV0405535.1 L,D-transpeptidase [Rhizobiaceae bacterium]